MVPGGRRPGRTYWYGTFASRLTPEAREPVLKNDSGQDSELDRELRAWVEAAIDAAVDKLGERTEAFYVGEILGITDWFVVTSGRNPRQVKSIVDNVEEQITLLGGPKPISIEGLSELSWVLMDFGPFVVHVFSEEARDYYELERLWNDVPRLAPTASRRTG